MAKLAKPAKGEPTTEASTTFAAGATGLAFKVSKEFRHEFKVAAAENDISMTALLHECFITWQEKKRASDNTSNLESDTDK